ncbi:MAG: MCP four helix bundle domain-containing protein, partial [Bacillaceae bacterium]|nr:MCP four helix bundle domain-containing protein [Bacillaceae bacterium]
MSFKKKQFIGLGITVFFLVLLLSVVLFMTNSIKTNMLEVVEDRYYKVNKVTDIRELVYLSDRHLLYVVNRDEQEDIAQSLAKLESNQKEIHNGLIELSTIINRSEARIMLGSIQSNANVYWDMERGVIELSNQGGTNEELRELYYSQRLVRDEIIQGISDFKDFQQKLMEEALADANETYSSLLTLLAVTITLTVVGIVLSALWVIRSTSRRLEEVKSVIKQIDYDDLSSIPRLNATVNDEIGEVSKAFNEMATSIEEYHVKEKQYTEEITKQNWIQTNSGEIINLYHKSVSIEVLAEKFISSLAPLMNAKLGAFYLKNREGNPKEFNKIVSYADGFSDEIGRESFTLREGLIGQSAAEKQPVFIDNVPSGYTVISTGIGTVEPKCIVITPVIVKDEVVAVIEFASLQTFTDRQKKLLNKVLETLGIAITNILGRMEIERLLLESQAQTEELQSQSEELQAQSEE